MTLILNSRNSGWSESSTLSCLAVMTLPFISYLRKHISLFPIKKNGTILWLAVYILCIATVIGTTARTGLVSLVSYLGIRSLGISKFFKMIPLVLLLGVIVYQVAPQSWLDRMNTTSSYETDSSSAGRIAVWRWTLDYAQDKPLGGGFNSYLANAGQLGLYDPNFVGFELAKAFHNNLFEVLGEHGYIGLFIFLGLIIASIRLNRSMIKNKDTDEKTKDLCIAFNHAIYVFCISGCFIGIAFKPIIYQLMALTVAHHTIIFRELNQSKVPS